MKSTNFGTAPKGDLVLELVYVATAIAVALAISVNIPRIGKTDDNRFPACYTNVCFS